MARTHKAEALARARRAAYQKQQSTTDCPNTAHDEALREAGFDRTLGVGSSERGVPCEHQSELTADGWGAFCLHCGEPTE